MGRGAALLILFAACGRIGFADGTSGADASGTTQLHAQIAAAPELTLATVAARVDFATLDATELHVVSVTVPADLTVVLPDASGPLQLLVDAVDVRGRALAATASTTVTDGETATLAVEIGSDLAASCLDGVTDNAETDIDCGGACPACAIGRACSSGTDCGTGNCAAGACEPVSGPPSWEPIADVPVGRIGLAAALGSDRRMYVFGGADTDGDPPLAEVDAYDADTNTWAAAPPLATPRSRIAGTADAAGTIYSAGGQGPPSQVVESFTAGATSWTAQPDLPTGRQMLALVADGSALYAIGGTDGNVLDETDELLLGSAAWSVRTPMPSARCNVAGALAADGTVVVMGGHPVTNADAIVAVVEAFTPGTNAWQTLPSLAHARSDLCAALGPDGRTYAIGGYDVTAGVSFVEAYRAGAAAWLDLAPLGTPRDSCAAAVGPDGRIYAVGGRAVNDANLSAEAYGPRLALGAQTAAAGSSFAIAGTNFAAMAHVQIAIDDVPVALGTSDGAGTLSPLTLHVPADLAAGVHVVRALDDRSAYPTTQRFTVP